MIAPSCSSLGPDARHAPAPGALSDRLTIGLAPLRQHSAAPRQFAIKQYSLAHWPWPGGAGSLAPSRSLSEACTLSASLSEAR